MINLKDVKRLEISLAILLMFIPLILKLAENLAFRTSISDYAYSSVSHFFVLLLTLSGSLFLYNGIFFKRHWYNSLLGISLFGVAVTPHLEFTILHYLFATIFFLGSIISIGLSSNIAFRGFKFLISGVVLFALALHFVFNTFSLLIAEWIGIIPISTHFIVKSYNN